MLKMAVGGGRCVGQYEDAILDFIHLYQTMQRRKMALKSNTQVIHVTGECRLSFEEEMQVKCPERKRSL